MYLHFFLLLFSSGVSSHFLSLKEMLYLEKNIQCSLIREIFCIVEAENGPQNMTLPIPCNVKDKNCAYNNTEIFIHGLNQMHGYECMKEAEKKMTKLQKNCTMLKKPSSHCKCPWKWKQNFPSFKKTLEDFLRWVFENQNCSIIRNDLGLHQEGKCTCPNPEKYPKVLI